MANYDLPFPIGTTRYGTGGTIPTTPVASEGELGQEYTVFHDYAHSGSYSAGPRRRDTQREVTLMLVRNEAAIALLPKRVVRWKSGERFKSVDGYTTTTAAEGAGVVDPRLPTAGVRVGDLFYIVRKGPALLLTDLAVSAAAGEFDVGDKIYALTAATSGATTAGRVQPFNLTATSTETTDGTLGAIMVNAFGRAMSAKTSANTNADLLADVNFF